jgi:hypothetical protein
MKPKVAFTEDLKGLTCSMEGCGSEEGPVYLHASCHLESPLWISFSEGALTVTCAECKTFVTSIKVAKKQ